MTAPLSLNKAVEKCQEAIHDMLDIAAAQGIGFEGITFTDIPVQYRDFGLSVWDVQIAPAGHLIPLEYDREGSQVRADEGEGAGSPPAPGTGSEGATPGQPGVETSATGGPDDPRQVGHVGDLVEGDPLPEHAPPAV